MVCGGKTLAVRRDVVGAGVTETFGGALCPLLPERGLALG